MNDEYTLTDIIKKLANDSDLNNESLGIYKGIFEKIYSNNYRHEYSEITKVLFSIENNEERDYLPQKIKDIKERVIDEYTKNSMGKLWDHINLENIRLIELRKISQKAESAVTQTEIRFKKLDNEYKKIDNGLKEMKEESDNIKKNIENSTIKSTTVLGIFAGIVMTFSGGLSFISSSLKHVTDISKYRLILVVLLLSSAIFNIIFMLIYVIGKINDTFIGSKGICNNPSGICNKKKLKCVMIRYPMAVWFNIVIIFSIFIITTIYYVDKYNLLTKVLYTYSLVTIVLISIFLVILVILLFLLIKYTLKLECEYTKEN